MRTVISSVVEFGRSWANRFVDVQGIDRAMALAAQAFSALIPLVIVYSAVLSRGEGQSVADNMIERFDLTGAAAESVRQAFTSSETVEDSISILGLLFLIVSALSFTRGMQRLYEGAYRMPTLGVRNTVQGLEWLVVVIVYFSVRPFVADLFDRPVLQAVASLALASVAWTLTPFLLLGRRMAWRPLLPGALFAAAGMTALAVSSLIWLPRTISSSAEQFGAMGVAFAMLSWLFAAGVVLVVAATGGAVTTERLKGRWR